MRYMVVEHFRNGDPVPIYERFRAQGRLAPDGLYYVDSWVADNLRRCYQIMDCEDPDLLRKWMSAWEDIVEFEVHPVITSADAASRVLLGPDAVQR